MKNLHSVSFSMSDAAMHSSRDAAPGGGGDRPQTGSALGKRPAERQAGPVATVTTATSRCLWPQQCCTPKLPATALAHAHAHSSLFPFGPGLYAPGQSDSVLSPKKIASSDYDTPRCAPSRN
jgi:hypothetical protein